MIKRGNGILMHITSLPGAYGIGDLGPSAYAFVEQLQKAKQRFWQILPINPTDGINGHSPYSCFSAFAGNPLLISPEVLVQEKLLVEKDLKSLPKFNEEGIDYLLVSVYKEKLFTIAFDRFQKNGDLAQYKAFCEREQSWLNDFALFIVIKSQFNGRSWKEWPAGLKRRTPKALKQFEKSNSKTIERVKFIQYLFFKQWEQLKTFANSKGISIIGDIPIYVNYDSVEVWCFPQYFKLNAQSELKFVSGCPPDYFSKTGQRWGNPVYDWAALKKDKYGWWIRRIEHNLKLFDYLRIDHFRGFLSYWQIPAHEKLAVFGRWVKGPCEHFFKTLTQRIKSLPLVAEDLGEITPDVPELMKRFNIPGMRVLLFAFGGDPKTNPHMPANYPKNCIAYTGTHDNNTIQGWYTQEAKPNEKTVLKNLIGNLPAGRELNWSLIKVLMRSHANTTIIPLPDVLGLGPEGRMNTPATKVHNWRWRLKARALTPAILKRLATETTAAGR